MVQKINRRKFFKNTAISSTACFLLGNSFPGLSLTAKSGGQIIEPNDLMAKVMKYKKINAHEHVYFDRSFKEQIEMADRLGIDKLVVSRPIAAQSGQKASPDEFKECNDLVLKAMKQFPDRYLGQIFINPVYQKESLEEIKRCVDNGMTGLKIYNQVKINDPLFYPIIEKFIDLKMMILVHAHAGIGVGGFRPKFGNVQPNASVPEDFVDVAKRYPEAMFQYAHLGGGGDWEYACKTIGPFSNIYADLSGSNNETNMVNFALQHLGEERLFFGTDGSYYQGVGVILSAPLTDRQREKVFFRNYNEILKKSGKHVD